MAEGVHFTDDISKIISWSNLGITCRVRIKDGM